MTTGLSGKEARGSMSRPPRAIKSVYRLMRARKMKVKKKVKRALNHCNWTLQRLQVEEDIQMWWPRWFDDSKRDLVKADNLLQLIQRFEKSEKRWSRFIKMWKRPLISGLPCGNHRMFNLKTYSKFWTACGNKMMTVLSTLWVVKFELVAYVDPQTSIYVQDRADFLNAVDLKVFWGFKGGLILEPTTLGDEVETIEELAELIHFGPIDVAGSPSADGRHWWLPR